MIPTSENLRTIASLRSQVEKACLDRQMAEKAHDAVARELKAAQTIISGFKMKIGESIVNACACRVADDDDSLRQECAFHKEIRVRAETAEAKLSTLTGGKD